MYNAEKKVIFANLLQRNYKINHYETYSTLYLSFKVSKKFLSLKLSFSPIVENSHMCSRHF